jgi:hypothetical protein
MRRSMPWLRIVLPALVLMVSSVTPACADPAKDAYMQGIELLHEDAYNAAILSFGKSIGCSSFATTMTYAALCQGGS